MVTEPVASRLRHMLHMLHHWPLRTLRSVHTAPVSPAAPRCAMPRLVLSRSAAIPRPSQVSKAKVSVEQKPWNRVQVNGVPHDHGERLLALAGLTCTPTPPPAVTQLHPFTPSPTVFCPG